MIVSFPRVKDNGELTGGEVTVKWGDIVAVQMLHDFHYDITRRDHDQRVIPNCCTIYLKHGETFDIQAEYEELKNKLKEYAEMFE